MRYDDARIEFIDGELERLKWTARQRGLEATKAEVINRLIASVLWLDSSCGERMTYELMQGMADRVMEQGPRELVR